MRLAISLLASALVFAQTDAWDTHHQAARKALNQKRYDVAAKEADAGFKEVEKAGPSDPRYIRSLMDRAAVESQDNLGTAERTLRFALDGAERAGTFAKDTALSSDLRKELIARLDDLASRPGPSNPPETQVYLRAALVQAGKLDPPDTRLIVARVEGEPTTAQIALKPSAEVHRSR